MEEKLDFILAEMFPNVSDADKEVLKKNYYHFLVLNDAEESSANLFLLCEITLKVMMLCVEDTERKLI